MRRLLSAAAILPSAAKAAGHPIRLIRETAWESKQRGAFSDWTHPLIGLDGPMITAVLAVPEMVVSALAASQGNPGIALGNVLGSNLFNTLAVVGIAGAIHPTTVPAEVFSRDILVMTGLTVSLFIIGYGFRGPGRINRFEGAALLACYVGYTAYLVRTVFVQ
jgi:hypothetical protein